MSRIRFALLAVALTAVFALRAAGQEPTESSASPRAENGQDEAPGIPKLDQSPLQIWLQPDKSGNLIPVPVFAPDDEGELKQHILSWSDIDRLLDRLADQQSPRVSCQRVAVTGVVNGSRANLEIELAFITSPQRWVRAPLGLASAVISGFESPTGGFLDFDEKEGFAVWLPPAAPERSEPPVRPPSPDRVTEEDDAAMPMMPALRPVERTVKLKASAVVNENGTERRMSIRIPRAPTSSLELLVDMPEAQPNLVGGDARLDTEAAGTGQTRITAEGIGGDLALSWRPKRMTAPAAAPILKAQGVLEVVLDEGDQLQASARLTVQSLNEPFQVFTVELPPGMRLRPGQSPEYEVTPSDPAADATAQARQKATVRLRQPTIGPVTVRLDAVLGPQAERSEFVEVGGFEIEEAVEQQGRVLLIAAEGDSISWVESANVVQSSDPLAGEAEEVAAQFRYFAQPFSLLVKAAPQKTRIRVEPTYVIEIFSDHVKLTADLAYQIQGAKASLVRVDMQGWELDSVLRDDVVVPVKSDQLAPLEIPLTSVSGDVTVRITAQRILEGAKGSLRIPLPGPAADFAVSAVLAVAPNDNTRVTPLPEQMHGLLPEPPTPLKDPAVARKATLFYRTRTGEPQPVFVASYEVKAGEVTVESDGEIRLADQRATIRQQFAYNFAYEPVDRVAVDIPREAYERGELRLLFDEAPIVPIVDENDNATSPQRVRLNLTPPMALGRHLLALEYSLAVPEIAPQQTIAHSLPLAAPAATGTQAAPPKLLSNTLRVSVARPLQAALDGNAWKIRAPRPAGVREELLVSADGPQEQLSLMVTHQKSDEQLSNAVDRLWMQTWLTAAGRRDHAALQITTHEERFRLRLPAGADPGSLIIFLGGRRLSPDLFSVQPPKESESSAIVAIQLESVNSSPFHLEMWYGYTTSRPAGWQARLSAPELLDVSWVRQIYWQLVLPPDEHLVTTPAGFHSEHSWRRRGWWWGREPTLNQRELEAWSGASQQPAPPAANDYLFSSFGAPGTLQIQTVHRTTAVLAWSGIVLVMGLLLLRSPPRRQLRWIAYVALIGSVIVIAAVALFPETTLLAVQCASIGAAGVALAWLVARIGGRRGPSVRRSGGAAPFQTRMSPSVSTRTERRHAPAASPAGLPHDSSL